MCVDRQWEGAAVCWNTRAYGQQIKCQTSLSLQMLKRVCAQRHTHYSPFLLAPATISLYSCRCLRDSSSDLAGRFLKIQEVFEPVQTYIPFIQIYTTGKVWGSWFFHVLLKEVSYAHQCENNQIFFIYVTAVMAKLNFHYSWLQCCMIYNYYQCWKEF